VVTAIIGLLVVGGGGAAGWYIMTLRQQQAATQGRLRQAESSLRETESALTLARDEHQRLASEYDALKQRWNEADAEVAHLTQRVTQLQGRMDTLTSERASLESQVREAQERANGLESKVSALRREAAEAEGARIALEADLRLAMAQSLTLAEAEQVAEIHAQSEAEVRRLHELLEEGADAYEELMARSDEMERQLVAILQAPPSGKGARAVAAVQPPVGSQPLRPATAQHLAKLHRRLGESYVATYQYPKAARAFEQSLTYKDDAVVHAKLAFIYTRLLPNVELAERHLALAAPGYPAKIALDDAARASDLPRSNLKMVMKWLTE
jgi:predicted  nucleic acid-binding Zn-ribbon protein